MSDTDASSEYQSARASPLAEHFYSSASSPAPTASSPEPRASSPELRASLPASRASSPESRASFPESRASSPELRASSPESRASSPEPRASFPNSIEDYVARASTPLFGVPEEGSSSDNGPNLTPPGSEELGLEQPSVSLRSVTKPPKLARRTSLPFSTPKSKRIVDLNASKQENFLPVTPERFYGLKPQQVTDSELLNVTPQKRGADSEPPKETPHKGSSDVNQMGHDKVDALEAALKLELEGSWVNGGLAFARAVFKDNVSKSDIQDFLAQSPYYVNGRWKDIPEGTKDENILYTPFVNIINAILEHFGRHRCRQALDSHNKQMIHTSKRYQTKLKTSPDITLIGVGPSFTSSQSFARGPTYAQSAGIVEIKTEKGFRFGPNRLQVGVYGRECFVQQPNRRFVYGLLLTEKAVQIFQFDRAGGMYSSRVNIHNNARTFVKFILGMCSLDEAEIGFETRIYWKHGKRYFKPDLEGEKEYIILNPEKPFHRQTIRGRGTVCWTVADKDNDAERFILKFSWRAIERIPEWEFLEHVAKTDIQGVGRVHSHAELGLLSDLRHGVKLKSDDDVNVAVITDRVYSWILQPYYGPAIDKCRSELKLLTVFRDAIAGHMQLLSIGILHRDISPDNILQNLRSDVVAGNRGLMIDFDMAIFLNRQTSGAATDFRTGTRAFQSIKVLRGLGVHDYLDDLESFFYVLCWICLACKRPGVSLEELPEDLMLWSSANIKQACNAKDSFLFGPLRYIAPAFSRIWQTLIVKLRRFFATKSLPRIEALELADKNEDERLRQADSIPQASSSILDINCSGGLTPEANADYKTILSWIDDAIKQWRELEKSRGELSEGSLLVKSSHEQETVAEDTPSTQESSGTSAGPLTPPQNIDSSDPLVLKRAEGFLESDPDPDSRIVKKPRRF